MKNIPDYATKKNSRNFYMKNHYRRFILGFSLLLFIEAGIRITTPFQNITLLPFSCITLLFPHFQQHLYQAKIQFFLQESLGKFGGIIMLIMTVLSVMIIDLWE